jgi:hypothetical protein
MSQSVLSMWTVYERPRDYPHGYIARRFEIAGGEPRPTTDVVIGSLDVIRGYMEMHGLHCLPRQEADEPQIVECWI